MKKLTQVLVIICLIVSCKAKKETQKNNKIVKTKIPTLTFLWETDSLLTTIESAVYNPKDKLIYTTSINGNWLKKEGKGFISTIDLKGNIVDLKWKSGLNAPAGTAIYNEKLYISEVDEIKEIDIRKKKIITSHVVNEAKRLNDIVVTNNGTIYTTGSLNGKLFSIKNGTVKTELDSLAWPNGLLLDNDNLLIGLAKAKELKKIDVKTNILSTFVKDIINPDGIIALGNEDFLVSSWRGLIHHISKNGKRTLLLDTTKEKINSADSYYIASENILLVPAMLNNKLMAYRVSF